MDHDLLKQLLSQPKETEWLEFKENFCTPEDLGDYLSALSNAARLADQPRGYLVFGIQNETHVPVGTVFSPNTKKKGAEDLIPWLSRLLTPRIAFEILETTYNGKRVLVFVIPSAVGVPTAFSGREKVRIQSSTKNLKEYPDIERTLWTKLNKHPFEYESAKEELNENNILNYLSTESYFDLLARPTPETRQEVVEVFIADRLVERKPKGLAITNLGAILFAKDISQFSHLHRKAPRVVRYDGNTRVSAIREQAGISGYAVGFTTLLDFVNGQLPRQEQIGAGLREEKLSFPLVAIREFVANALIHQDFAITGAGPLIEIFNNRVEITNPGCPLIDTDRFIDHPPRSRNEALSGMMHRLNICEERGSGVDRALLAIEAARLPAPKFEAGTDFARITLYATTPYSSMSTEDKLRACYQHACVQHFVLGEPMSNATLRERLNISEANYSLVSRLIKDSLEQRVIKLHDPQSQSKKHRRYLPYWA